MKTQCALLLVIFLCQNYTSAQNIKEIDSLTIEMCKSLSTMKDVNPKEKIEFIFQNHLTNYFDKLKISSQADADSINKRVYFRLQKNCAIFRETLDQLEENKSDWKKLELKPSSSLNLKDFKSFLKGGLFYYKEFNGDSVNVALSENLWIETFIDGTTSKLIFNPKKNSEFELQFIESNNETRKNFSIKGEIYNYGIYAKENNEYFIWVMSKEKQFSGFKLYKK